MTAIKFHSYNVISCMKNTIKMVFILLTLIGITSCNISEAYSHKILTKENIKEIASYHNN